MLPNILFMKCKLSLLLKKGVKYVNGNISNHPTRGDTENVFISFIALLLSVYSDMWKGGWDYI